MPIQNETILFLSLPRHDGEYMSTPWQIALQLAKSNHVLFADHPYTFFEMLKGLGKPAIRKRVAAYFDLKAERINGITVLPMPFVWPVNYLPAGPLYKFFSWLNNRIVSRRINRFLRDSRIHSLIYVNSFDFYFADLSRHLKARLKLKVYHCIDPMVKTFTLKHGSYLEEVLSKDANIIISTSPALQKKFALRGFSRNYLVPNGADVRHFSQAPKTSPHPALIHIEGKVLGYFGNIERRIDYTLLLTVVSLLGDWHLVLAGPVDETNVPKAIREHERVTFTGPIPYGQAPAIVNRFDVAIIPFVCDEVSAGIYPLKMFEYLAAGKPVVATNFNPDILDPFSDHVFVGHNAREFATEVLHAYATDSEEKAQERLALASQNSWVQRAKAFSTIVGEAILNKKRDVA